MLPSTLLLIFTFHSFIGAKRASGKSVYFSGYTRMCIIIRIVYVFVF